MNILQIRKKNILVWDFLHYGESNLRVFAVKLFLMFSKLPVLKHGIEEVAEWKTKKNLQDIKNNTLIIWGDKDKSCNLGQAQTLEKNISDSNLVIFEGCAHNVHLEQPDQFNHTIKDFLL